MKLSKRHLVNVAKKNAHDYRYFPMPTCRLYELKLGASKRPDVPCRNRRFLPGSLEGASSRYDGCTGAVVVTLDKRARPARLYETTVKALLVVPHYGLP